MSGMTRHPLILAAVAGALALGACGSDGNNGSAAASRNEDKAFEGALKFAKCMREHGVDMPDPQRSGGGAIRIGGPGNHKSGPGEKGKRLEGPDPKAKAANDACAKYLEAGGGPSMDPAEVAKRQDAFVAYARCMRSKGIDMPDPKVSANGGIQIGIRGGRNGALGPESPAFKAADGACHRLLAQVEPKGSKAVSP
jgi:hypothetical protein